MPTDSDLESTSSEFDSAPDRPRVGQLGMQNMRVTIEAMAGGPLLPPQALLEYETILPGTAERLLALHEKQVAHQQDLERSEAEHRRGNGRLELHAGIALRRNGPRYAIAAVGLVLALAAYVTFAGYPYTAGTIATALVVGLAVAFLTPRIRGRG